MALRWTSRSLGQSERAEASPSHLFILLFLVQVTVKSSSHRIVEIAAFSLVARLDRKLYHFGI